MLEHLTRDVQAQVGAVHQTLDKAEMIGQQILALLHDHHGAGIELQALLIIAAVVIIRRVRRDEQQRGIGRVALGGLTDHLERRLIVVELALVILGIFLIGDLALRLLPDGGHAVEGLILINVLILVLGALFELFMRGLHANRIADIVAVFLDQLTDAIDFEELTVLFFLGILLDVQGDDRAGFVLLTLLDGVTVRA